MERITAIARGKVQGVGYRQFVARCAHLTGVHGYVKNMPDGSVLMVAESSHASLEDFVRVV
jgi:acylphosphatase